MMSIKLARGYDSILLDRSDRELVAIDRTIRSRLAKGYPDRWTPPDESELGDAREARSLLDLYRTLFLANHGESPESQTVLRRISQESQTTQIRIRAVQFLCQGLLADNLDYRHDRQLEATESSGQECRSLCEHALLEFKDFPWSNVVTHQFHAALGILDYYSGDRLAAKFHLTRALDQYSQVRSRYDKYTWVIALVYYYSGTLANELKDFEDAVKFMTIAARGVPPLMRVGALVQLAAALVNSGDPRGAKKIARRGLRSPLLKDSGEGVASELKGWMAEAELDLGKKREAARLFREVIEAGDAPIWEARARACLDRLNVSARRGQRS